MPTDLIVTWGDDTAYPGSTVLVWSPERIVGDPNTGFLTQTPWELPPGWVQYIPLLANDNAFYSRMIRAVQIAADTAPGNYPITWVGATGNNNTVNVTVAGPVVYPNVRYMPRNSTAADWNRCIARSSGNVRMVFEPGEYLWDGLVYNTDPNRLVLFDAEGAVFQNVPTSDSQRLTFNKMVNVTQGLGPIWFKGCTIRGTGYNDAMMHGFPYSQLRIEFHHVTFEQVQAMTQPFADGATKPAILFYKCVWRKGAGTGDVSPRCWFDQCSWQEQTGALQLACFFNGTVNSCVTRGTWWGTRRMIFFQGDCQNNFLGSLQGHNVGNDYNESECFLIEAGGFAATADVKNNFFVDITFANCSGPGVNLFGNGIHHNTFYDVRADVRGEAVVMAQLGAPDLGGIHDNAVINFEHSGRIRLLAKCQRNYFAGVFSRRTPLSSGNQIPSQVNLLPDAGPIQDLSLDQSGPDANIFTQCYAAEPGAVRPLVKDATATDRWAHGPKRADLNEDFQP